MKQFFSLLAAASISLGAFAQLPNGSIAPDFTATDINGVQHNLYSLLDSGYSVILDFSATWCGPCWGYHEEGTLEAVHETYGMAGSDEVRVLYLESDDLNTGLADLEGTGPNTQGDWVTGTEYPIIDNAGSIADSYGITGYPTILTVCPNRILTESGPATASQHASVFQADLCQPATQPNDGFLVSYTGEYLACGATPATLSVNLMNMGTAPLTACTITAYDGSTPVGSDNWTGALATYETENVTVTTAVISEDTNFDIQITSTDDNVNNNTVSATVYKPMESTNNVRFSLLLDSYPQEVQWALFDENDQIVEQAGPYAADDANQEFVYPWTLDLGCYTFVILDDYGDGLHGSWFDGSGPDGNFSIDAMDGSSVVSNLYAYSSPDEYAELAVAFEVTSVSSVEETLEISDVALFPNPTSGISNIQFTSAAAAKASLEVTNLLGERVIVEDFGMLAAGTHRMELNLTGFEAGVYLVNVNAGGNVTTLRVTKQ